MDIPSLFMIPSAVSSGKVHSVFPNSTDADFDFNRDSSATRVNSQGLIEEVGYFGSELVTNGSFDTDSNWLKGTGWSIANGIASKVAGSSGELVQLSVFPSGFLSKTFKITFTLEVTAGSVRLRAGTNNQSYLNSSGTYSYTLTPAGNDQLKFDADSSFAGSVDNVSCKEITGDRARLNYEIEGGLVNTKPSLLLEPQRTNLVSYSENFSQSYWAKNKLTVTPNAIISPTGELNASLIQETSYTSSTNSVQLQNAISLSAGTYTLSFYVKNNKGRYLGISFGSGSERVRTNFDFNTNTFKALSLSGTTTGSASFTTLGDFYRLSVTATFPSTVSANITITPLATDTNPFAALQDSDNRSFYMWGVQLEQQSYSTSIIPTNGITQTRAAETCNGAGTSSILPSEEGILYADMSALVNVDSDTRILSICENTAVSNRVSIMFFSDGRFKAEVIVGGTQVYFNYQTIDLLPFKKYALRWKASDFQLWIDGTKQHSQTSGSSFSSGTLTKVKFDKANGTQDLYGNIRDIRVYNTKEMTDSEVDILLTKITS